MTSMSYAARLSADCHECVEEEDLASRSATVLLAVISKRLATVLRIQSRLVHDDLSQLKLAVRHLRRPPVKVRDGFGVVSPCVLQNNHQPSALVTELNRWNMRHP